MSLVITPPLVSMPRVSGVTSSSSTSFTSPASTPAWMAAPTATTSSGFTPRCGSLPVSSLTFSCTAGMRVMPPTITTWSIESPVTPASLHRLLGGPDHAVDQLGGQLVELRAGEPLVEVLGHRVDRRDERQVDLGLLRRAELGLGLLGLLVEALEGHLVLREVLALGLLELVDEPVDDRLVEVVAAQVVVTRGGLHLEHAVADLEHRHVERAAAEVEHEDRLVLLGLLVEPVRERCRGGLVDDALYVEAGDLAGVLGGLALVVVEVRGHGDHRAVDRVAQVGLGVGLQLLEDHRADLRRRVLLAARLDERVAVGAADDLEGDDRLLLLDLRLLAAHEALDGEHGVLGVGHGLALGGRAHEALAALGECDDRRGRARALGVLDHDGLAALENRHATVGRAKIDSDGLAHRRNSSSSDSENLSVSMADPNRSPHTRGGPGGVRRLRRRRIRRDRRGVPPRRGELTLRGGPRGTHRRAPRRPRRPSAAWFVDWFATMELTAADVEHMAPVGDRMLMVANQQSRSPSVGAPAGHAVRGGLLASATT